MTGADLLLGLVAVVTLYGIGYVAWCAWQDHRENRAIEEANRDQGVTVDWEHKDAD